ncbi:ComEC/Rec2 family competence protein [Brevibacterium paucivorans]|uniref:ComEC/Rec2 family competence protein n=1 Tax=Brevibacterium paucivorans TaxID=170994 RepID=UPI00321BA3E5
MRVILKFPATVRLAVAAVAAWTCAVLAPPLWVAGVCAAGACVAAVVTMRLTERESSASPRTPVRALAFMMLFACGASGITVASVHARNPPGDIRGEFTVITDPTRLESGIHVAQLAGRTGVLTALSRKELPAAGTRIHIDANGTRDGPQTKAFVDAWHITGTPNAAWRVRASLRTHLRDTSGHNNAGARLLPGLVVGDTSGLDAASDANMKAMSLTHITAVSGSNISLVALTVLSLMRLVTNRRLVTVGAAVAVTAGYVFVVGPDPSVIRAAGMGLLGAIVLIRGTGRAGISVIASTVVILLVMRPELSVSAGFILSVTATTALMVLGDPMTRIGTRMGLPRFVAQALAIPLTAQIGVFPVSVALGNPPSAWAVLANAACAPVIAPATLAGMLVLCTQMVPPVSGVIAWFGAACSWWIPAVAQFAVTLPGAHSAWSTGVTGIALATCVSALSAVAVVRRSRGCAGLAVVALVVGSCVPLIAAPRYTHWVAAVCDVGQGSATVLKTGQSSALVVDTGAYDDKIDACLRSLNVTHVDLALSHLDKDHVGAIEGVSRGRTLGTVYVSPPDAEGQELKALHLPGTPTPVEKGHAYQHGQITWSVLWPGPTRKPGSNATSLVIRAEVTTTSGAVSILIPGDVGKDEQRVLARDIEPADILLAPHHGSRDLDERFFRSVAPRVGAVSVGPNTYGHPTGHALRAFGPIPVLRTDQCGTLVLDEDGNFAGHECKTQL